MIAVIRWCSFHFFRRCLLLKFVTRMQPFCLEGKSHSVVWTCVLPPSAVLTYWSFLFLNETGFVSQRYANLPKSFSTLRIYSQRKKKNLFRLEVWWKGASCIAFLQCSCFSCSEMFLIYLHSQSTLKVRNSKYYVVKTIFYKPNTNFGSPAAWSQCSSRWIRIASRSLNCGEELQLSDADVSAHWRAWRWRVQSPFHLRLTRSSMLHTHEWFALEMCVPATPLFSSAMSKRTYESR